MGFVWQWVWANKILYQFMGMAVGVFWHELHSQGYGHMTSCMYREKRRLPWRGCYPRYCYLIYCHRDALLQVSSGIVENSNLHLRNTSP